MGEGSRRSGEDNCSTDSGFGSFADFAYVAEDICWVDQRALAKGAELATKTAFGNSGRIRFGAFPRVHRSSRPSSRRVSEGVCFRRLVSFRGSPVKVSKEGSTSPARAWQRISRCSASADRPCRAARRLRFSTYLKSDQTRARFGIGSGMPPALPSRAAKTSDPRPHLRSWPLHWAEIARAGISVSCYSPPRRTGGR